MKRKIIMMVAVLLASIYAMAAVTISVSAKTVQKSGGGGTITVSGTGAWTAVADSSWITVKSGSSGDGDGKVMFTVGENTTADTRIGHINVNDNVYTITQYGYAATISPSSVTVDRNGGSGTINVTTDAGITWTAKANVDWLSVTPTSGRSVGTVTYTVAAYPGVVSRSGSITIAGNTFTVTQTGVDVNIEPAIIKIGPEADILMVDITALASTKWNVMPNSSWISVLDKEQGHGDYALALAVNSNPSFAKRTGTVAIGTATLTVVQAGKETAELAIDPEYATASPSGAYGNVAVYATPDAPWVAESLTSWLTISEGKEGAGNGNIKYVASPNPTLDEREGVIKITPPYKEPELDLYAGLECWMPSFTSIPGNHQRYFLWGDNTEWSSATQTDLQKVGDTFLNLSGSDLPFDDSSTWDGFNSIRMLPQSLLSANVAGPGILTFWWRASTESGRRKLRLSVDGSSRTETSSDWSKPIITISGNGNHTLKFDITSNSLYIYYNGNVDFIQWDSTATDIPFDGTAACCLNGAAFAAKGDDAFSASISFSVDELDRVNRLMTFAGQSVYLDIENRLIFHETPTDFVIDSANAYYTLLIRQNDEGDLSLYAGRFGEELTPVLKRSYPKLRRV